MARRESDTASQLESAKSKSEMTLIQNDAADFEEGVDFWRRRIEKRRKITEIDQQFIE